MICSPPPSVCFPRLAFSLSKQLISRDIDHVCRRDAPWALAKRGHAPRLASAVHRSRTHLAFSLSETGLENTSMVAGMSAKYQPRWKRCTGMGGRWWPAIVRVRGVMSSPRLGSCTPYAPSSPLYSPSPPPFCPTTTPPQRHDRPPPLSTHPPPPGLSPHPRPRRQAHRRHTA